MNLEKSPDLKNEQPKSHFLYLLIKMSFGSLFREKLILKFMILNFDYFGQTLTFRVNG